MRKLATAAAVSLALASGGAFGLGLGEIQMRSALNQPMDAEIRLSSVKPGEADSMIVTLASEEAFNRAGIERSQALNDLRFKVEEVGGRPVIRVTSRKPVVEPFLNFLIEVDWPNGRMVREYTVLLDPPVFMSAETDARSGNEQAARIDKDNSSLVAPTPIERDTDNAVEDGFEVEMIGKTDEVIDESTTASEAVALDSLLVEDGRPGADGEAVSLSDLEAPNTSAAEQFAETSSADYDLEVELMGGPEEVSDDFVIVEAPVDASAAGSEEVSLDTLADDDKMADAGVPAEVTVGRGDTLYGIASRTAAEGTSVQQMMLALLAANESSFINGNINLVKAGAILRVPPASEAQRLTQAEAVAEIGQQNQLWQEYRDNLRGASGTRLAANSSDESASADADGKDKPADGADKAADDKKELSDEARSILDEARDEVSDRNELRIVADDSTANSASSATSDETGDESGRLGEISKDLQLAREELASARLESGDLEDQASELGNMSNNLDTLVNLRQNEVARLEAQLADAREAANAEADAVSGEVGDDAAADGDKAEAEGAAADAKADAESLGDEAADATAADAAGKGEDSATDSTRNALSDAGQELEQVELLDGDGASDEAAVDESAPALDTDTASKSWVQNLLDDPRKLGLAGVAGAGVLGTLGLLLFRRRKEKSLLDIDEREAEFIDENEAEELQSELDGKTAAEADGSAAGSAAAAAATGAAVAAGLAGADDEQGADHDASATGSSLDLSDVSATLNQQQESADGVADPDETLSEVEVYLAYGLHGQAEELLEKAIANDPANADYRAKLLETYHHQGNAEAYGEAARDFHTRFGGEDSPHWASIVAQGQELLPDEPLFAVEPEELASMHGRHAGGEALSDDEFSSIDDGNNEPGSVSRSFGEGDDTVAFDNIEFDDETLAPGSDDGSEDRSQGADVVSGLAAGGVAAAGAAAAGLAGKADDTIDEMDAESLLDQSFDPAFVFDETDLEATGDFSELADELTGAGEAGAGLPKGEDVLASADDVDASIDAAEVLDSTSADDGVIEFPSFDDIENFSEADMPSVDDAALDMADATLDEELLDADATLVDGEVAALTDDLTLDFDQISKELDLDSTDFLSGSTDVPFDPSSLEDQARNGSGDQVDSIMDMARAYIDMGDKELASNALDQVMRDGTPEQVSAAEDLMRKIS